MVEREGTAPSFAANAAHPAATGAWRGKPRRAHRAFMTESRQRGPADRVSAGSGRVVTDRPTRVLFVDRVGAQSIWSLMEAIAATVAAGGGSALFCRLDDARPGAGASAWASVETVTIPVPAKRFPWDPARQHRVFGTTFRDLLERYRPDIVHTNFAVPGVTARWVARRAGVPAVVSTQHELFGSMSPHLRLGVRLTERCADAVIYVSHAVARSFGRAAEEVPSDGAPAREPGRPSHLVIHNGVDAARITAAAAGSARVPGKLVCAGRLIGVKGQVTLLRALPRILEAEPIVRLTLIGAGPDEAHLRGLAASLGVADEVRFAGWLPREQTVREMASAAAVVVPSDGTQEGFGLVVAEAMASGAPVVASDIAVFREVLCGEQCGWLFTPGDPQALAATVTVLLADPAEAARRAERAGTRVMERFGLAEMAARYAAVYASMLKSTDRGGARCSW